MLNLLDKLAVKYVEWRYDRQVAQYGEKHHDIQLKRASTLIDEGDVIVEAVMNHPGIMLFAADMVQALKECGADNYITFDFLPIASEQKLVEVTIGWSDKLTPAKKVAMLEERIAELERSLNKEFREHQLTAAVAEARLDEMERLAGILKANGVERSVIGRWVIEDDSPPQQVTTLEDLIRRHNHTWGDPSAGKTNEFRLVARIDPFDVVFVYMHPLGENGETLDFVVNGNELVPLREGGSF